MIQKPNSLTLMNQIDEAVQDIKDIKNDITAVKEQIETKLGILNTYYKAATNMLSSLESQIKEKAREQDTVVFAIDQNKIVSNERYGIYGQTIHPYIIGLPDQVFNFMTSSGALFKDNVSVTFSYEKTTVINGESSVETVSDHKDQYSDMLRHETDSSKKDVFFCFPVPNITMTVEIKPGNLIGNTNCNMIEICPYLPGTFTINKIRIWTIDQYLSKQLDDIDATDLPNMSGNYPLIGSERIMLPDTYQIYRVEFDIMLHYMDEGYPFGLRHLYFYDAKADRADSYVIVKIDKDDYINSLGSSVTLYTPSGNQVCDVDAYGSGTSQKIEFYAAYENGLLQIPLQAGTSLPRNITSFYAKIPVFESIKAITFNDITTR